VGLAFRTLFSQPDATILTRAFYGRRDEGGREERYWEAMLDHCIAGNLQSVLDEHVHLLRESLGVATKTPEEAIKRIAEEIVSGMALRATVLRVDDFKVGEALKLAEKQISFRCRNALRFDTDPGEDGGGDTRADQVRVAFNSPFRPFVLASTAVGQEGLDFHLWCHAIFHWNLPSNPVDFEQREGRVHRYKGHVVRRSVASALGLASCSRHMLLEVSMPTSMP
jgi:Helicase conserved C-terminal domain